MKTQAQFDEVCRTISEDDWQRMRKRERNGRIITAVTIAIPMVFVLASAIAACHMWLIH